MITISNALFEGTMALKKCNIDNPRLDAEIILAMVLGVTRLKVMTEGMEKIDDVLYGEYLRLIGIRSQGMPAAYIIGKKEFMGMDFVVRPGVLIPRCDTEIIVMRLLDECKKYGHRVDIADVGCGSGAIGISAAVYAKNAAVTLIDISEHAINTAMQNMLLSGVGDRAHILKGDLLEPAAGKKFDIIVSNPPYIRSGVIQSLQREVREYEPHLALDGGQDGLVFYNRLTHQAYECLNPGGALIYEIGYDQGDDVGKIMKSNGFTDIEVLKDLAGLDRCMAGRKC